MLKIIRHNLYVLLLLALLLPCQVAATTSERAVGTQRQDDLVMQRYLLWQQFNRARNNPLAVLERLDIPLGQAQAVFGEDAEVLDQGLPPLAWNERLYSAAAAHGRDMLDNLYYNHISSTGADLQERIAVAGYQALTEGETLGALVFSTYVEFERAIVALVDNMLRDELTGASGVSRNIFSSAVTEIGVSFDAEALPLLADQPYVYLVVVNFAQPLQPRNFIIADTAADQVGYWFDFASFSWQPMDNFGVVSQVAYPAAGSYLVTADSEGITPNSGLDVPAGQKSNYYFDLQP